MKLLDLFKVKRSAFVAKNMSVEDSLIHAADLVITEITKLSTRYFTAESELADLDQKIEEEKSRHYDKERNLKYLISKNDPSVKDKARLVLLLAKVIKRLEQQRDDKKALMKSLIEAGKQLKEQQASLADRLELVRETQRAESMGIVDTSDVNEAVGVTTVKVDDILMRIDTFKGKTLTEEVESVDVEQYLDSLKGK